MSNLNPGSGLNLSLPPQISKALSSVKIPSLPDLGMITNPYPSPTKPIPATKTQFQVTPFKEQNLMDPFKTLELAILTEEQLAVDQIGDVLSKFLPPELIGELTALPELANKLLQEGKDLIGTVMDLADKLPTMADLGSLLRDTPIMSVLDNIDGLMQTMSDIGTDISSVTTSDLSGMFDFLGNDSSQSGDTSGVSTITDSMSTLDQSIPPVTNIRNATAIVYGISSSIVNTPISLSSIMNMYGVSSPVAVLGTIQSMSSTAFQSNVTTLKLLSSQPIEQTIRYFPTQIVTPLLTTLQSLNDIIPLVNTATIMSTSSNTDIGNLVSLINTYTPTTVKSVVDSYETVIPVLLNNSNDDNLLQNLTTRLTQVKTQSLLTISLTNDLQSFVSLVNVYSPDAIINTSLILKEALLTPGVTIENLGILIDSTPNLPLSTLSNGYKSLSTLGTSIVTTIASSITLREISTIINTNPNITGTLLDTFVRKISYQAAKSGNLISLVNIVSNFPTILTVDYKRMLLTTILQFYNLTKDDITMGMNLASIHFVNNLSIIFFGWEYTKRTTNTVFNLTPLLTASKDSIKLLMAGHTSISAVIQYDNTYNIPKYLLN
jgi:hypothetical protein